MSKLSFASLAVYLIVVSALVADVYLLSGDCPVTIRIVGMLLAGGYCMNDQVTDELRRHLSHVISILQPYAAAARVA